MAFELVAGHAVDILGIGNMTFAPREAPDFNIRPLEARDGPQTVNIFIDSQNADILDYEYAVSIVEACASQTVYALHCTSGAADFCGAGVPAATVTENASQYKFSSSVETKTAGVDVKVTAIETCQLAGTTAATCTATAGASASGQSSSVVATTTYTDAASKRYDVSVTAGNEKLVNPTGKCSAASSLSTRAVALWGFLGAVGAVGVLAL